MNSSLLRMLAAVVLLGAGPGHAQVILQDHDIQPGLDPAGGFTALFAPGTNAFFLNTNQAGVATYEETEAFGLPGNEQLQVFSTTAASNGFQTIMRYSVATTERTDDEPFIAQLKANPVFAFEAERLALTGLFASVNLQVLTDAPASTQGLPTVVYAEGLSGARQTIAHELWNNTNFITFWNSWKESGPGNPTTFTSSFFQIRFVQQVENSATASVLVAYDDFRVEDPPLLPTALVLQNHDIQAGLDPEGGDSNNYVPGTNTFFEYYRGAPIAYGESEAFGEAGNEQLVVHSEVTGSGFQSILRYGFSASQRNDSEPLIADLLERPLFAFDCRRLAFTSVFVSVVAQLNTDVPPPPGASINMQGLGLDGTRQTLRFDLLNNTNFQAYWSGWTNGAGSFFQFRIVQQTDSDPGSSATVAYDDFRLEFGDSDGDGLTDNWERHFCGTVTGCAAQAQTGDGDNLTFAEEYILDLSPDESNMPFEVTGLAGGSFDLTFAPTSTGRLYGIDATDDLAAGTWMGLGSIQRGSNAVTTLTDTEEVTNRAYRVRVAVP